MRLSTAADRDEDRAVGVLQAAFEAGLSFLDTADAYCHDDRDVGHNERLIARALAGWTGDRARIRVATKGGLTRPGGRWVADGRARHLRTACEASRRALGVERIHLYQLHVPDPRAPLSTSVRALASLLDDGWIENVGLCNVSVGQIEEARGITEIAAVQVEMSLWQDENLLNGVAEYCVANGIPILAYRPLGGPERRRRALADPILRQLAERHGATPFEVALAWLRDLSPLVMPIPGPSRLESVASLARVPEVRLTAEDHALLDECFPAGRIVREPRARRQPRDHATDGGEVVLVAGLPGAGKSTLAQGLVGRGYVRLNRDEAGGRLAALVAALDREVRAGGRRFVLDNTYTTRRSRAAVIEKAWTHELPVRCLWLDTSLEDAQFNAAWRMVARYGRLLGPEEMGQAAKSDPGVFPPTVQFRYRRELEPPSPAEGFSRIEVVGFERHPDPALTNRALLVWCDGILRRSRSGGRTPSNPDDVEVLPGRAEVLRRYRDAGFRLLGLSWHPEIALGRASREEVEAGHVRMQELLGLEIDVLYCPHGGGPPACWCRRPMPGLGVVFIQRHSLDAARCHYVGEGAADAAFARRMGFRHEDAEAFFDPARRPSD
jgi:aryl-alcohol dehydrogenase-like predicted oxidoreductase/histidinol phosphatase-like enzyme